MATDNYIKLGIQTDLMNFLSKGKNVYIESGGANDKIIGYEKKAYKKVMYGQILESIEDVIFTTTACIFPKEIKVTDYDNIDYEEWNGSIFVKVRL